MNKNSWIEVHSLTKQFSAEKKIGEIDFSINRGEIFALCGGNGAGKSTLLKLIIGSMKPTSGSILIEGIKISTASKEFKKLFSYMPDEMVFPKQLTGLETLLFFARLRKISDKKVEEMLELVGLQTDKDRAIKTYSKGMQQRLSLAQALLPDTSFLILDEPTNGLDPYWVYKFKEIIADQKAKGKTILFTTHILSLVEEIADRAAFMEEGKLLLIDEVASLTLTKGKKESLEHVFFNQKRQGQ